MTYQESKVGLNTALAAIIALILTKFGVDVPNGVIVAAVGLVGIVTAYFSPGWADRVGLKAYPAGITAGVTTVLAWLLPALGINELSQADLVTLVGALTLIVGVFTPAAREDIDPEELDRERVGI
jgi:hypothetical protein